MRFVKLYRSYDTRLRPTERRPDLYLKSNVFGNDCDPIAKSVLKIYDRDCVKVERDQIGSDIDWLWDYKGELHIISTAYHDGVHYASNPLHFFPIITHLVSLHSQGFVHGDIRAYNMVLLPREDTAAANESGGKEDEGWLIDFDYGSKTNVVTYPWGYKRSLADGLRPGKADQQITIRDDWRSLFGLILYRYDFLPKKGDEYGAIVEITGLMRASMLIYYDTEFEAETSNESAPWEYPASLLREYLKLMSTGYIIKPELSFRKNMIYCGLWNNSSRYRKNASGAATGSVQKYN